MFGLHTLVTAFTAAHKKVNKKFDSWSVRRSRGGYVSPLPLDDRDTHGENHLLEIFLQERYRVPDAVHSNKTWKEFHNEAAL